ncbi:MAG: class I SAM-dependent methyltransferase [Myxococcota bacterium]|nr:class I SAM-dependent methyltransferase [Myxococcota bacterium]
MTEKVEGSAEVLAGRARRLFASDVSQGFVDATRERVERSGAQVDARYIRSHLAELELPDELDLVVCGTDDDVHTVLARIRAALGPRGLGYVRTTVSQRAQAQVKDDADYQAIYRVPRWYEDAFVAAGFEIVAAADATEFMADEIVRDLLGARLARTLGRPAAWSLRLLRRLYRRPRARGVRVWMLRPRQR